MPGSALYRFAISQRSCRFDNNNGASPYSGMSAVTYGSRFVFRRDEPNGSHFRIGVRRRTAHVADLSDSGGLVSGLSEAGVFALATPAARIHVADCLVTAAGTVLVPESDSLPTSAFRRDRLVQLVADSLLGGVGALVTAEGTAEISVSEIFQAARTLAASDTVTATSSDGSLA